MAVSSKRSLSFRIADHPGVIHQRPNEGVSSLREALWVLNVDIRKNGVILGDRKCLGGPKRFA
jgi:hypothetical protein